MSDLALELHDARAHEAATSEILLSMRAYAAVEDRVEVGPAAELALKGFHEPVEVFRVISTREDAPHGRIQPS